MHLSRYPRLILKLSSLFFLCALLFLGSDRINAQSRAELEHQRKQKEKEIAALKKRLSETGAKERKTLAYLADLNELISQRQSLINTLQNQLNAITHHIEEESDIVSALDSDVANLKKDYAKLMYYMYKNRRAVNQVSFVFAAHSFNEAIKRVEFVRFYTSYRETQVDLIEKTEASLASRIADLKTEESSKKEVLASLDEEEKSLESNKQEQNELMHKLQGDEKKIRRQLAEQQRVANKLDKAIRNIIAKEIADANRKARAESKENRNEAKENKRSSKRTAPNEVLAPTPEMAELSARFAENRSRLPWPVENGAIIEHFGVHAHPTLEKVTVNCNGVIIKTAQGSKARCVFGGKVTAVITIPGANNAVIINHGNYFTVYSNLDRVSVHTGEKLTVRQEIGTVGVDKITGDPQVELEIWKAPDVKLDPEQWLIRR